MRRPSIRRSSTVAPRGIRAAALAALLAPGLTLIAPGARAGAVPHQDHVIVVVMENKSFDEARAQPYTASLMARAATFTRSHAVTHPSQPNYFALWAADTLGVLTDECPAPGGPFHAENLGHACETAGLEWRAYSENLPVAGGAECAYDGRLYARKHDPWTNFSNLDHTHERPYSDLAADIAAGRLPALAFVIPNNCHNSHDDRTAGCGLADADAWLASQIPAMITAAGPHGLVILTWDEDDGSSGNRILTVFAGGDVAPGKVSKRVITHYTVVRTICDALGLPAFGHARTARPIDDVWVRGAGAKRGTNPRPAIRRR